MLWFPEYALVIRTSYFDITDFENETFYGIHTLTVTQWNASQEEPEVRDERDGLFFGCDTAAFIVDDMIFPET